MINHHSITVNAPAGRIFGEIVLWGESGWWPKDCPMRYTRLTGDEIGVGTRYRQKVQAPFGPQWEVEVVSLGRGREVSRRFLNGMFEGVERVYIIRGMGGCEVHFMMDFEVAGWLNRFLWRTVYRGRHDNSIKKILSALKRHLEGGGSSSDVEEHPSTAEGLARREFFKSFIRR